MIKNVMEVNKKVGAGAQKSGLASGAEQPNKRAGGVRAEGVVAEAGEVEQLGDAAVRGGLAEASGAGEAEQKSEAASFGEDLVARLMVDYPEIRFRMGKRFMFRPPRTVVVEELRGAGGYYGTKGGSGEAEEVHGASSERVSEVNGWGLQLLHEVGHALSGHRDFWADVERLKMEREAWERARGLCAAYNIWYDEEFVEAALDTYRDWLHRRSQCPECGLTRYQGRDGCWHCPGCEGL